VPALCWADANGRLAGQAARAGSALLNDSRYAHSLDGSTLRLVLLRTSYGEDPLPDTGRHKVRMALVPHGKALAAAELTRLGSRFNHPMVVLPTDVHAGDLPSRVEGLQAGPANVVLSCVKKGDDSDALIVRLFETAGKETSTARVALDNTLFGEVQAAVETDLLERPLAAPTAKAVGNGFTVRLGAHAITTVAVTLARPLAPKKKKKKKTANPERRR